jgi:hypothetical protein
MHFRVPVASLVCVFLTLGCVTQVQAAQADTVSEIHNEAAGSFVFFDPGTGHPITVWYCRVRRSRTTLASCS